MTSETTTKWTCSRCKKVEVTLNRRRPTNWVQAMFRILREIESAMVEEIGELCNECGGLLVTFVNGGDVEREERINRMMAEAVTAEAGDDGSFVVGPPPEQFEGIIAGINTSDPTLVHIAVPEDTRIGLAHVTVTINRERQSEAIAWARRLRREIRVEHG